MISTTPYDSSTHANPWLMETNNSYAILGPEGVPLTASYIWSKSGQDREDLVNWVFRHYRDTGFVKSGESGNLMDDFAKLRMKDPNDVLNADGEIKNSSPLCNNVCRHFVWEKYHSAKGGSKSRSVIDVFNDDQTFLNVLKNRMGYCVSMEDGEERPYVFTITDSMVLQGIRSTGYGYNVSLFKPLVGKYLYGKYAKNKVFDYSAGWGARCLAAMSLGIEYYGVDPLTSKEINGMIAFFGGRGFVVDGCSEDRNAYAGIPKVDCVMSSPPYFDLESYSNDARQSVNKFGRYEDWVSSYWGGTVVNCLGILEKGGYFIMVVKDYVEKRHLSEDMGAVCRKGGLVLEETIHYRTSTSHLSGKRMTSRTSKNDETVFVFYRK